MPDRADEKSPAREEAEREAAREEPRGAARRNGGRARPRARLGRRKETACKKRLRPDAALRPRRPRPGHSPAPQRAMPGLSRHALRGARGGPLRRAVAPRPRALVPGGRNRRKAWAPPPVLRCRAIKSRLSRRARRRIASQRGAGKHRGKPSPAQGLDVERPQSGQGDKKWRRAVFRFARRAARAALWAARAARPQASARAAPRGLEPPACPHAAASSCPRRTSRFRTRTCPRRRACPQKSGRRIAFMPAREGTPAGAVYPHYSEKRPQKPLYLFEKIWYTVEHRENPPGGPGTE